MLSFPFPVPFLFVAFLSNMLLRRHGKSIFTNCTPTCPCPFPFPFLVMNLVFPGNLKSILERKGKERKRTRKGKDTVFNSRFPFLFSILPFPLLSKQQRPAFFRSIGRGRFLALAVYGHTCDGNVERNRAHLFEQIVLLVHDSSHSMFVGNNLNLDSIRDHLKCCNTLS